MLRVSRWIVPLVLLCSLAACSAPASSPTPTTLPSATARATAQAVPPTAPAAAENAPTSTATRTPAARPATSSEPRPTATPARAPATATATATRPAVTAQDLSAAAIPASFFGMTTVNEADYPRVPFGTMGHPEIGAWAWIERAKGTFDFSIFDKEVSDAAAHGLADASNTVDLAITLGESPPWAAADPQSCSA